MIRRSRGIPVFAFVLFAVSMTALITGCPKHENFPQPLAVKAVPTPQNFVISQPDTLVFDYDFTWTIDDPQGLVDRYRIYLLGNAFTPDELVAETRQTTFLATFPFSISGARFAVAAVSTESVEGDPTWTQAP